MPGPTPWMGTVTLPLANTAYALNTLVQANPNPPTADIFNAIQFLTIQANENGQAGTVYYVGNVGMSAGNKGWAIFAGQVLPIYSMGSNVIRWDHIYLMATKPNEIFNIAFLLK